MCLHHDLSSQNSYLAAINGYQVYDSKIKQKFDLWKNMSSPWKY